MSIAIPQLSLITLIGPSGSGKSTFARQHFKPTEVLSSDYCRGLVGDDENDQTVTNEAFDVLYYIAAKRLAAGRLTVIDATNVKPEDRRPLVKLARDYHVIPVAIMFNLPEKVCRERNRTRPDRDFGGYVIRQQRQVLRRNLRGLKREGFRHVFIFETPEEIEAAEIVRTPLWNDRRSDHGPFDIVGDVHGCFDELVELLTTLGYQVEQEEIPAAEGARNPPKAERTSEAVEEGIPAAEGGARPLTTSASVEPVKGERDSRTSDTSTSDDPPEAVLTSDGVARTRPPTCVGGSDSSGSSESAAPRWAPGGRFGYRVTHAAGRKLVFLGDLVDRGPKTPQVLRLVMSAVADGVAWYVPGNHDIKLMRKLRGKDVQITHGLAESLAQLADEPAEFREEVCEFLDTLVSHYVLDDGKLVVAHAGMKAELQGRGSGAVRDFALYGETTGETDEFGLPIRYNWAADYRGRAIVVYGHTPVPEPEWLNRTINIDTGCVFGGKLTALRYPERELVSVPAKQVYTESKRPFLAETPGSESSPILTAQQQHDDVLDLADVLGKRIISTRLQQSVTIREENATAALEVMSRFAVNPKWLIYLPPTMSPCATSPRPDTLEYPTEAFAYYRHAGIPRVVCEQKHMGSRAVVVVGRDEEAVRRRFGISGEGRGILYTRTGRRFFEDPQREGEFVARIATALMATSFWDRFKTDWACLDCELMPWSAKAQALLRQQYAAVGAASRAALNEATAALGLAKYSGLAVDDLLARHRDRAEDERSGICAYQQYCWDVHSLDDLKLVPFHLLATEGRVPIDRDHVWHMDTLAEVCAADTGVLLATPYRVVDLTDPAGEQSGTAWWEELTAAGGEGMVVKPLVFVARGRRGIVQPAVKCRGREYLRIIYGPEYTTPENLDRLRSRGLGAKRSLALREFALGIESLERFVRGEPLRRIHECVFGVLALESEPVDPRL